MYDCYNTDPSCIYYSLRKWYYFIKLIFLTFTDLIIFKNTLENFGPFVFYFAANCPGFHHAKSFHFDYFEGFVCRKKTLLKVLRDC